MIKQVLESGKTNAQLYDVFTEKYFYIFNVTTKIRSEREGILNM